MIKCARSYLRGLQMTENNNQFGGHGCLRADLLIHMSWSPGHGDPLLTVSALSSSHILAHAWRPIVAIVT